MDVFIFATCPAPAANVTEVTAGGKELPTVQRVAPSEFWLPGLHAWLEDFDNIVRVCDEVDTESVLGDSWSDLVYTYAQSRGMENVVELADEAFNFLADMSRETEISNYARTLLSATVRGLIVDTALDVFDPGNPETDFYKGEVLTGGMTSGGDYPTESFTGVLLLDGLSYFKDFEPVDVRVQL